MVGAWVGDWVERLVVLLSLSADLSHMQFYQGTPLFRARAVALGTAVPLPKGLSEAPSVPDSPNEYSLKHSQRINKFLSVHETAVRGPSNKNKHNHQWTRHELEHDVESVFWLLLYWAMVVQPKRLPKEVMRPAEIPSIIWGGITGPDSSHRNTLVRSLAQGSLSPFDVTHTFFTPLCPLIESLATFLVVDRHWLEPSDERHEPEYLNEVFQRLILAFILKNRDEEFMDCHVDTRFRKAESTQKVSSTLLQVYHHEVDRKRPSPQPSIEDGSSAEETVHEMRVEDEDEMRREDQEELMHKDQEDEEEEDEDEDDEEEDDEDEDEDEKDEDEDEYD
jgi:hypothetical protein